MKSVQLGDHGVDLLFHFGNVGGWVLFPGGKDAVDDLDDRFLLLLRDVRDGQLLPVVGIEIGVAAAVGAQELGVYVL